MANARIMLADDHRVVGQGLCRVVQQEMGLQMVGEAASAEETLTQVDSLSHDVTPCGRQNAGNS